jgi:hypothetical protein
MEEEEEGRQGHWDFSSDFEDSGSDCSSLIAAGQYDESEEQEEEQPAALKLRRVVPPLLGSAARAPNSSSNVLQHTSSDQALPDARDALSGAGADYREQLNGSGSESPAALAASVPVHAAGEAAAAAAEEPAAATAAVSGVMGDDDDESPCEEQHLDDAVGLHEDEYGQQQGEQEGHVGGSTHSINRCGQQRWRGLHAWLRCRVREATRALQSNCK